MYWVEMLAKSMHLKTCSGNDMLWEGRPPDCRVTATNRKTNQIQKRSRNRKKGNNLKINRRLKENVRKVLGEALVAK